MSDDFNKNKVIRQCKDDFFAYVNNNSFADMQ